MHWENYYWITNEELKNGVLRMYLDISKDSLQG